MLKFPNLSDKWQGLKNRERFLVIVFLLLIAGYLSYMFYFQPQALHLKALFQEMNETLKMRRTALAEGWNDIPGLRRQISETERRIEELRTRVPASRNTPGLLAELYRLAAEYDLVLNKDQEGNQNRISFGELEKGQAYSSYDVSMKLVGRSSDIYGFLYEVQRLDRLSAIDKALIWSEEPGWLKCDLTIKVFVVGELEEDPQTYPFMNFERFSESPYIMFRPSAMGAGDESAEPPAIPDLESALTFDPEAELHPADL